MQIPLTRTEVRHELVARGLSIAQWAADHGFSAAEVYAVLSGRSKGLRGRAGEVARALQLIDPPDSSGRFDFLGKPQVANK